MQSTRGRVTRYTVVSLALAAVNAAVFFGLTLGGVRGTTATIVTFLIMLPPAFEAQRRLVWGGGASARTYLSFTLTAVATLAFAYGCLFFAERATADPVVFLAVYLMAYGTTFVAKYVAYDQIVFR